MTADPIDYSAPLPLVEKAFVVINHGDLSFANKKVLIDQLEQQASGYELTCFADVHEALIVTASMNDLLSLNESERS